MIYSELSILIKDIECDPFHISLEAELGANGESWFFTVARMRSDTHTGTDDWGYSHPYLVTPNMSRDQVARKILAACIAFSEHEVREVFKYKGRRIFGPHINIDNLWHASELED